MTLVYDKDGNEFKVTHQIDVDRWLKEGYTLGSQVEVKEKKAPAKKDKDK